MRADKAYLSRRICNLGEAWRGALHLHQRNITRFRSQGSKAWREMLVMNRRSRKFYRRDTTGGALAETAISTVKRRFSCTLYSKKRRGQKNELRLKAVTYNLSI